jgi:hypothetical protein
VGGSGGEELHQHAVVPGVLAAHLQAHVSLAGQHLHVDHRPEVQGDEPLAQLAEWVVARRVG